MSTIDRSRDPREGEIMSSPAPALPVAIVLVAAGKGSRAGREQAKQYVRVAGRTLLAHAIEAVATLGAPIQPVIGAADASDFAASLAELREGIRALVLPPVIGGETRQLSVKEGLEALARRSPPERVLIHDAARAFASRALLRRAADSTGPAMVPAVRMTDTIREVSETSSRVLDRTALRAIQTPQAFAFDRILVAHRDAAASGSVDFPDDSAVAEWAGLPIGFFEGDPDNMKITQPGDFAAAEARLLAGLPDVRIGQGYDVHAFGPGASVWLGGVEISHTHALLGHSDADVLMHAITDAILGALAEGDIGSHFPPSDPRWKGASSDRFLRHAVDLLRQRGGMLAHVDGTVICEAPKVGPHRDAIRARLAEICGLTLDRVAVKATTSEELGFTGRREGIAAMATATIRLPLERSGS
jgi:2-C-methyl-D-erythritol 4-phosphate cytidylyltransferase/2-C-methyl-D-erythritol 2,4-cyclodiphosphate synthase